MFQIPVIIHHYCSIQVGELVCSESAKQQAVLESDSGRFNYESCRSSYEDTEQAEASELSSTRPQTPAVAAIKTLGASYSNSLSSMSSDAPTTPAQHAAEAPQQGASSGIKSTFNKLFGSNWGSESSSSSGEGSHGLIAAFRAIMPKTSGSQSGSGKAQHWATAAADAG